MESWETARVDRLENRIDRLERKEWERRDLMLRFLTAVMVVLSIAVVVISATHSGH